MEAIQSVSQRPFGLCQGQLVVPEDFDAPLPGPKFYGSLRAYETAVRYPYFFVAD